MDIYQVPGDQQLQSISMWLLFYFQFVEILFPLHGTSSQGVNSKKYSMQISRLGCSWFIRTKSRQILNQDLIAISYILPLIAKHTEASRFYHWGGYHWAYCCCLKTLEHPNKAHKLISYVLLFWTMVHILAHYLNIYNFSDSWARIYWF